MVWHQSVWNPVLTIWPPSSHRSSTDHWSCVKSRHASRPSRGCTSFASWGSLTCHRSCWSVLLCCHWICPLHVNNCLVQLSYQIWAQKTTEGSPDCRVNHWYNLPHSLTELYLSRVSKRFGKITLDPSHPAPQIWTPHIQHTPSLNCYRLVDATELWTPERPDTETVSFPKQSISWTLDIKHGTHNTIMQLFIHHTYLFFYFQICTCQTSLIFTCIVYCVFAILYIAYLYIVLLLSVFSCCFHSVALWSFCHYNKILCKHTWTINLILILLLK